MSPRLRVVSPYKPFAAESQPHLALGPFDWIGALRMLAQSVERACGCETLALTDVATPLAVPALGYATTSPRLMEWILEVSLCYLDSPAFDRDTIMASPDVLVFQDLRPHFHRDFTMLVRSGAKYALRPILNQVQWWPHRSKARLVALYRAALARAGTLPEDLRVWGADTEPFRHLFDPLEIGVVRRGGLTACLLEASDVLESLHASTIGQLESGATVAWPQRAVVDFKYLRKRYMAAYFAATIGARVPA